MCLSFQLLVAGVVGIYFCATDFATYAGNVKVFIVKVSVCNHVLHCNHFKFSLMSEVCLLKDYIAKLYLL